MRDSEYALFPIYNNVLHKGRIQNCVTNSFFEMKIGYLRYCIYKHSRIV